MTGFVTALLGVAEAPVAFSAGVGAPVGYVSSAFAGEVFAGGATLEGALAGAAGGAVGSLPGIAGAALGGGVGAYVPAATAVAVAAPIVAGALAGGGTYLGAKAVANAICGPE